MKKTIEIKIDCVFDSIINVKKKRFNEGFTTLEEVEIIKKLIQKRMLKNNVNISFSKYSNEDFNIIDNLIIKINRKNIKKYISDSNILKIIYDERFIYLCLCEIMVNKLNDSIEHTCLNCSRECFGNFSYSDSHTCFRWEHNFKVETANQLRKYL